jgi:hypothetical protein
MDSDGDADFLMADGEAGAVYLYDNRGGGRFVPRVVARDISAQFTTNLRIADFNRDGRPDFVVGDNRNLRGTKVFLQRSAGTFRASAMLDTSWMNPNDLVFGVAVGDLDGDGYSDVAMLGYVGRGEGQVRWMQGRGDGTFSAAALLADPGVDFGGSGLNALAAFDFDQDGDLDLVTGGGFSGEHFVYTNDGRAVFTAPLSVAFTLGEQSGVDTFDADHDGDHDLVVAAFSTSEVHYVENLGGRFAAPRLIATTEGMGIGIGAPPLPGRLHVQTPNQLARWGLDTRQRLAWTYDGDAPQFVIEVSRNGGRLWDFVSVVENKPGPSQNFFWTVTGRTTSQARLRVTAVGDETAIDVNDANIRIGPRFIEVLLPRGPVVGGSLRRVFWKHNLGVGVQVSIEVSRDGGGSWRLVEQTTTTGATTASFVWDVDTRPTRLGRIRVRALDGRGGRGTSPIFPVRAP